MEMQGSLFMTGRILSRSLPSLSIAVGNFSAVWQTKPKRLMAYSSIAQTDSCLWVSPLPAAGHQFMLFMRQYYVINFLVFIYLQYFESFGFNTLETFSEC